MEELNHIDLGIELTDYMLSQTEPIILCPSNAKNFIKRNISAKDLKTIHTDKEVAREICLLITSYLSTQMYWVDDINDPNQWYKPLSSQILKDSFKHKNVAVYIKIINILKKYKVIEVRTSHEGAESYVVGEQSKQYRLAEPFRKSFKHIELTTKEIRSKVRIKRVKMLKKAKGNTIADNALKLQPMINLPTIEEINAEGKRLSKIGAKTNKGKVITYNGNHSPKEYKDKENRAFVTVAIGRYNALTKNGTELMIPIISGERAGYRVYDSLNLMPSWIRNLVKINGKSIVQSDYSSLHPNIAMSIYGGSNRGVSHDIVSEYLGISRLEAKVEHLSFFNKNIYSMQQSPLHKYYRDNESEMLNNIIADKRINSYKSTSKQLFKTEVNMMSAAVLELNKRGIIVMYVFDALYGTEEDTEEIREVMNQVAKDYRVETRAAA